jgi:hypothetical protein
MRHVKTIAVLLALSPASAMAQSNAKGQISDAQMACAAAATKSYLNANMELVLRATASGLMSVDDTIAQRRLVEGYCKQWAACLVSSAPENFRETVYRATFSACLNNEAKEDEGKEGKD